MQLIKVHNNWPSNTLGLDITLGNVCNHKCWYCWPGSNAGNHKFPDLDILKENITHLIQYYQEHTNKKVFDIHFVGGEPTHWPKLFEFIKYLKENFNCLISMTSNGSKKLSWWEEASKYFDRVHMSCHNEFVDLVSFRNVCDLLYDKGVVVSVSVMMDPKAWDICMDMVDYLKLSRNKWTIRYVELIGDEINYTDQQVSVIKQHRARKVNLLWFLLHNKYYRSKVKVTDTLGKVHNFQDNEILVKRLNNFYGWQCSLGIDRINVTPDGYLGGTCGQSLYGLPKFNIYQRGFVEKFTPEITPVICSKVECVCNIETVIPKQVVSNKKVIPIYVK